MVDGVAQRLADTPIGMTRNANRHFDWPRSMATERGLSVDVGRGRPSGDIKGRRRYRRISDYSWRRRFFYGAEQLVGDHGLSG